VSSFDYLPAQIHRVGTHAAMKPTGSRLPENAIGFRAKAMITVLLLLVLAVSLIAVGAFRAGGLRWLWLLCALALLAVVLLALVLI
jgi:hypothetical protein